MSVFSSHPRSPYLNVLGALLVLGVLVSGTIYFGGVIRAPLTASQLQAVNVAATSTVLPTETVFPQPVEFDDEGVVKAILAGGQGIAIELNNQKGYIQAYSADSSQIAITEGPVHIRGKLTEISCAYVNTLFNGQCTPTVIIDALETLPIRLVQ